MIDADLRQRRLDAIEEHFHTEVTQEFDRTLATFNGHPHYEIMATGQVFDGDDEVMGYYRTTRTAFPDQRHDDVRTHVADDAVITEFDLLGTNLGEFYGLPPTGKAFRVPVIAVFFFEGDRIVNERIYFDAASLLTQIGRGEILTLAGGAAVSGAARPTPPHQLAQINVARLVAQIDSPEIEPFVAALEPVNTLADAAPGFVWRLQTEDGDATAVRVFDDDMIIVNMSVWESVDALTDFVYRGGHTGVMRRRGDWFSKMSEAHLALWWVTAGERPTPAEGVGRLELLRKDGPTVDAFTFRQSFEAPVFR